MFHLEGSAFGKKRINKEELDKQAGDDHRIENIQDASVDTPQEPGSAPKNSRRFRVPPIARNLLLGAFTVAAGTVLPELVGSKDNKQSAEIEAAAEMAKIYSVENNQEQMNDYARFLTDDFLREVALGEPGKDLLLFRGFLQASLNDKTVIKNDDDSIFYADAVKKNGEEINQLKAKASPEEIKEAKDKMTELIVLVEKTKAEALAHLSSEEFLNKLAKEMALSPEAAREHQKVRVGNVKNISVDFQNSGQIQFETKNDEVVMYYKGANLIVLPYNLDLANPADIDRFCEALLHEILHESTQGLAGLSPQAWLLFKDAARAQDASEVQGSVDYFSNAAELVVRKQILDLEMEQLGLKKYGQEFTDKHYQELQRLKKEGKLSRNAEQLLDHIKPEKINQVMNELAQAHPDDGIYRHPGWDYRGNNQA